jgi:hypothetical protein
MASEIDRISRNAGIELTSELRALWGWRDGTDPAVEEVPPAARRLGPLFRLTSLQQAIELSRREVELADDVGLRPDDVGRWQDGWLLVGLSRESFAATTESSSTSEVWRHDLYGNVLAADTLADAVRVWTRALDEGWWAWDPSAGSWILNHDEVPSDISRRRLA